MSKPKQLVIGKSRIRADVQHDVLEYIDIKEEISRLNKKSEELKKNIKGYMTHNNVGSIVAEDKQIKLEEVTRSPVSGLYTAYDVNAVRNILSDTEFSVVSEVVVNRDILNAKIKAKEYSNSKIISLQVEAALAETTEQFVIRKAPKKVSVR